MATALLHQRNYSSSWNYLLDVNPFARFALQDLAVIFVTQKLFFFFFLFTSFNPISGFWSRPVLQTGPLC